VLLLAEGFRLVVKYEPVIAWHVQSELSLRAWVCVSKITGGDKQTEVLKVPWRAAEQFFPLLELQKLFELRQQVAGLDDVADVAAPQAHGALVLWFFVVHLHPALDSSTRT
jgi:hypothetical protein